MAKKRNRSEEKKKKSVGSIIVTILIALFIILIWLVIFAVFIKLDVGGFGNSILRPLIKDIPVINQILPDVSEEQIAYENDYPYNTLEEAIDRIKELESINEALLKDSTSNADMITDYEAEINRLKVFEEMQSTFQDRVKEFEQKVVFADQAPSIEEYKKYYESINPSNAEEIYRQVVEQTQIDNSIKEKADMYRKMDPKAAAKVFETMTADIDLVAKMLLSMRPTESAKILDEMDTTAAAKITKKMFDLDLEDN